MVASSMQAPIPNWWSGTVCTAIFLGCKNLTKTSTWLVTGAAGFIGSNLCTRLIAEGHRVIGLDNLSTGKRENLARLTSERFSLVEADIRDAAAVRDAVHGCDVVAHLAAQVSVPASFADPMLNDQVNGGGFLTVLDAAGRANARLMVYASSCAIYGDNEHIPLAEGAMPRPLSPYAATKLLNEHYAAMLANRYPNMAVLGMRMFNIFGPGQDADGGYAAVIPRWIQARLAGQSPQVFGDGSATRDFCHVDNVTAFVAGLGVAPPPPGAHVCNIGTGRQTSLLELDKALRDALTECGLGHEPFPPLVHGDERHGDIRHSVGDIALANDRYGFRTEVGLERGLALTLAATCHEVAP
jgi:UDP-N-acetylglucosamine 4-epimerase